MKKSRKCYVIVKTQQELDALSYSDRRIVIIAFGDKEHPASVTTPFNLPVLVSGDYHATFYTGNMVHADDHAHIQVSSGSQVYLKDFAGCEVWGASFVRGAGNSKIYLMTDKAEIERTERNRMYRRRPDFG